MRQLTGLKVVAHVIMSSALLWASGVDATAADAASGTGWSLSDKGVLTVGKDYKWTYGEEECEDGWRNVLTKIKDVVIEDGQTWLGSCAFKGCTELTGISIPGSVRQIAMDSFSGCAKLTSIVVPGKVTKIESRAFYACSSLASVTLPESVTEIWWFAFQNCTSLTDISLPSGITKIGGCAFSGCTSLKSIDIPAGVATISHSAFQGCSGLDRVILHEGTTTIGDYAFADCKNLASIAIPKSVTTIGDNSFEECDALKSINLPEGITKVDDYTFRGCDNLASVIIPKSVTAIGDHAFESCSGLKSVTSLATMPPSLGGYAFTGVNCPLIVPAGTVSAYESSEWAHYFSFIHPSGTNSASVVTDNMRVSVSGGVITVGGHPAKEAYDLTGRKAMRGTASGRGVYIVHTPCGSKKAVLK